MYIFLIILSSNKFDLIESEQVIKLPFWLKNNLADIKSPDLNPLDYHVWVRYWDAKTDQHCRAEDCLVIDME